MIGDSAGRSSGNRTGEGAERRNTQRERADIDPVRAPKIETFGERVVEHVFNAAAFAVLVFFMCLGAIIVAKWFGVIS